VGTGVGVARATALVGGGGDVGFTAAAIGVLVGVAVGSGALAPQAVSNRETSTMSESDEISWRVIELRS
jgi:hypothetical protein